MEGRGVVAFASGKPHSIHSNKLIARIAAQYARELRAPVYTQLDILLDNDLIVVRGKEEFSNPPPTLRIARDAVRWAIFEWISELWIIAAYPHMWRCKRDVKYAVFEADADISVVGAPECGQISEEEWFCPDSVQPRTRSKKAWERRERILRVMPMWIYKYIAG